MSNIKRAQVGFVPTPNEDQPASITVNVSSGGNGGGSSDPQGLVAHELGPALGLPDSASRNDLMYGFDGGPDVPQPSDIARLQSIPTGCTFSTNQAEYFELVDCPVIGLSCSSYYSPDETKELNRSVGPSNLNVLASTGLCAVLIAKYAKALGYFGLGAGAVCTVAVALKGNEITKAISNAASDGNCFRLKYPNPTAITLGSFGGASGLGYAIGSQIDGYEDNSGYCTSLR